MRKFLIPVGLSLILAFSVFAGEHKKCDKPVQDCLNSMVTKLKSTGFIGVEIEGCCDKKAKAMKGKKCRKCKGGEGYVVTKLIKGTPAESSGIKVGDVMYGINGIKFNKENDEKLSKVKVPGKKVTVNIRRDGVEKDIKVTLAPMPADIMAKWIGEHMMAHAKQDKEAVADK